MSKIIFFDIDGTLYDSRIGIPESTVNALNQLIAQDRYVHGKKQGNDSRRIFPYGI